MPAPTPPPIDAVSAAITLASAIGLGSDDLDELFVTAATL